VAVFRLRVEVEIYMYLVVYEELGKIELVSKITDEFRPV
jgi:hypothetical protein